MKKAPQPAFDKAEYLLRLSESKTRLRSTLAHLVEWVGKLDENAARSVALLEQLTDMFPCRKGGEYVHLAYDIHTSAKRYATLGVSVKSTTARYDLARLPRAELIGLLAGFCSKSEAAIHAKAFEEFQRGQARIAALKFLGVEYKPSARKGPVLLRWLEELRAYGTACVPALQAAVDEFLSLSERLDEAIFEFNGSMGPARFRSIRCTYQLDDSDLLGPARPELKVVTSIHPLTKQRRYNTMTAFKGQLRKKRVVRRLTQALGREPSVVETKAALEKERDRKPTDLITQEVIKACYLGRHAPVVFEAQENLVTVMRPWAELRAQLQALL